MSLSTKVQFANKFVWFWIATIFSLEEKLLVDNLSLLPSRVFECLTAVLMITFKAKFLLVALTLSIFRTAGDWKELKFEIMVLV